MSTTISKFHLLNTTLEIEKYTMENNTDRYWDFEKRKVIMFKNVITKFAYDEIGIIINSGYDFIKDGKNTDFAIIFDPRENTLDYVRRWWYKFSRCEAVGIRGTKLELASISDYNNLKDCIRKKWLLITGPNWSGIENYHQEVISSRVAYSAIAAMNYSEGQGQYTIESSHQVNPLIISQQSSAIHLSTTSQSSLHHLPDHISLSSLSPTALVNQSVSLKQTITEAIPSPCPIPPSSIFRTFSQSDWPDCLKSNNICDFSTSSIEPIGLTTEKKEEVIDDVRKLDYTQDLLSSMRAKLEFSFYLRNHDLKVVDQTSNILKEGETIISRIEYEKLLDSKLKLSKELESLTAGNVGLEQRIEAMEKEDKNWKMKEESEKMESLKLVEDLRNIIFHS
ncbi:hypothetical protein B9Z19DRAFT_1069922 [Tuber borchii]|uniref:Uncharacterized protein n=1 Tax=Tuber borchii TaxID=42251 RepID=A0A2T6Z9S2_TUBBO|nr:hypothetical protein B9Z19DRAFT_1069922 [Tuber borchii]